jgi:hypothetical protein
MKISKREVDQILEKVDEFFTELSLNVVDLVSDNLNIEVWVVKNKVKIKENLRDLKNLLKEINNENII